MKCNASRFIMRELVDDEEDGYNDDKMEYDEEVDIDELLRYNSNFIDLTRQIKFTSSKPLDDYNKQVQSMMQDAVEEEEEAKQHMQGESRLMCKKQKSEDDAENEMWSLYDVLRMPAVKAEKLFTCQDYLEFARSDKWTFLDEQQKTACVKRLTEKMARGYFKYLAMYFLIKMSPLKELHICELIFKPLSNKDLSSLFLAYTKLPEPKIDYPESET
ncbi:hypothetical protein TKK_0004026 [Trichogramma kaykai]